MQPDTQQSFCSPPQKLIITAHPEMFYSSYTTINQKLKSFNALMNGKKLFELFIVTSFNVVVFPRQV